MASREAVFERLRNVEHRAITNDEFTIENEDTAEFDWHEVDVSTSLTRNHRGNIPVLATPMPTISEVEMAVMLGKEGGGAVIHHVNTPDEQKEMVRKVKLYMNGIIETPRYLTKDMTVEAALSFCDDKGYDFRTLPVVASKADRQFLGLMNQTTFDLFKDMDKSVPITEAMFPKEDVPTAPANTQMADALAIMRDTKRGVLPLLDNDGKLHAMYLQNDVQRVLRGNPHSYNLDESGRLRTFAAVSTYEDAVERVRHMGKYLDVVVVDTSHGESKYTFSTLDNLKALRKTIQNLREEFGTLDIVVGNVSNAKIAAKLAEAGPDAIRIGRGPGGICISRERLGGGLPQASAVYECSKAVKAVDPGVKIIADGGVRGPGDIVKYLALGADSVMVGSMIAATDEAAAPVKYRANRAPYKEYNGMGSMREQLRSASARARYESGGGPVPEIPVEELEDSIFVEGVEKDLDLRGSAARIIRDAIKGLRKEMHTGNFANIRELQEGVEIRLVSAAAASEGQASK
jgi:IMP dehydrogenase